VPAPTHRLRLIRGGADGRGAEAPADARSVTAHRGDTPPYAELLDIAGRCSFYAALTSWVFDSMVPTAGDSKLKGRRR
jgi:hypothetical protein